MKYVKINLQFMFIISAFKYLTTKSGDLDFSTDSQQILIFLDIFNYRLCIPVFQTGQFYVAMNQLSNNSTSRYNLKQQPDLQVETKYVFNEFICSALYACSCVRMRERPCVLFGKMSCVSHFIPIANVQVLQHNLWVKSPTDGKCF